MREGTLRVEPDGLACRRAMASSVLACWPSVVRGRASAYAFGIFWVEPDGLGAVGNALVVLALQAVGGAPLFICLSQLRVESNGLTKIRDGFCIFALVIVLKAATVESEIIFRV